MAKPSDVVFHHDYDGIEEFDNDLPGWWKALFVLSIIFSFIYLLNYHVFSPGDLQAVEYAQEIDPDWRPEESSNLVYHSPYHSDLDITPWFNMQVVAEASSQFEEHLLRAMVYADGSQLASLGSAFPELYEIYKESGSTAPRRSPRATRKKTIEIPDDLEILTATVDLESGQQIYKSQCQTCHGDLGQGGIGPNLTDEFWIHGGEIVDLVRTITIGVPAKGMIPWLGTLDQQQIHQAASFILEKLLGTTPPKAKSPQGEKQS